MTLKTCVREGCEKTFDDPPRRWTQPRLYCSPECRNAVGYAREKAKKAMAKDIPKETTDDAPEEAPRRRTTTEVERAVLATLGRRPKRLISIIEESGVCRSSVCRQAVILWVDLRQQLPRHHTLSHLSWTTDQLARHPKAQIRFNAGTNFA